MNKMKKIATGRARREQRQQEAIERNAAYRASSVEDRLRIALARRGESKREVARLNAQQTDKFKKIHEAA